MTFFLEKGMGLNFINIIVPIIYAIEVMFVTDLLTDLQTVSTDLTDVTLVSEDTIRRPYCLWRCFYL